MCICDQESGWVCVQHKYACSIRRPKGLCDCGLADALEGKLPAALEALEEAQGERDALMKAGVTDYSKLTGANRVDCHFCNGVWRTEDSAKHKSTCPLGRILSKEGE